MPELNSFEVTVLAMIELAAMAGRPCPSNLDMEMELGCNSTSVAPGVVKSLEDKGYIRVTRYQRAREVEIIGTGAKTAPHPDRKTSRQHVPRGFGASRPSPATDRKPYRSR